MSRTPYLSRLWLRSRKARSMQIIMGVMHQNAAVEFCVTMHYPWAASAC